MSFDPSLLRPAAVNSATGNRVWTYISTTDDLATIKADDYFQTSTTSLAIGDIVIISGTDGVDTVGMGSIGSGGGFIIAGSSTGGTVVRADEVTIDPALPDIGGSAVPADVQAALENVYNRLNLKVQNFANIGSGTSVAATVDTSDPTSRKLVFRRIQAGPGIIVQEQGDSVLITNSAPDIPLQAGTGIDITDLGGTLEIATGTGTGGGGGGSGGGGTGGGGGGTSPNIPPVPSDLEFDTGIRLLFVTNSGGVPKNGLTPTSTFTTIQAALNSAQDGDVILVKAGKYRERPSLTNFAGTSTKRLWIVAEDRGQAIISDLFAGADDGTTSWTDQGGGVYSVVHGRPYIGSHNGDFLMYYKTESDLRAATVEGVNKPQYGIAHDGTNLYVKLRGGINPNGVSIQITETDGRDTVTFTNCDNVIFDGFVVEGAGDARAIQADSNCDNLIVRNCIFTHSRFGVRAPSNCIIDWCEIRYIGAARWQKEIRQLDGATSTGAFTLVKDYYNAAFKGGNSGNALLEGAIDNGQSTAAQNVTISHCLITEVFDGSRLGVSENSECFRTVFLACLDDGVQLEDSGVATDSAPMEVHDCRFIDCFSSVSHQGSLINGNQFVYRNIFEVQDTELMHPSFFIKTVKAPPAAAIQYYHNLFINRTDIGNDGFGQSKSVWFPFSNGNAFEIANFYNNIVVFEDRLDNVTTNPTSRENNVLVAPASNSTVQGTNGVFAGTSIAALKFNSDFSLQTGSPAIGAGRSLISGHPDSRTTNSDVGPFPFGETPGDDWPRPTVTTFDFNPPTQWPRPGP